MLKVMSNPGERERFRDRRRVQNPARLLLFLILTLVTLSVPADSANPPQYDQELIIELDGTRTLALQVEVAADADSRRTGLMFRRYLPKYAGMLFDYRREQMVQMWMKNTRMALDMLFIDAEGRIVHIVEHTRPGSLEIIDSEQPVRAVLEINAGSSAAYGIRPGHQVRHAIFGD